MIRFADKSPIGWAAVEEYESDDLAENSEDEKKLRAAERLRLPRLSRSLPKLVFQGSQILLKPEIFKLHKSLDLRLLLRLFHFLLTLIFISSFVPPDKSSLPTSALTAISEGNGPIRQPALFFTRREVVSTTLAPVQRPQSQPPSDLANVLARLGPDKYSDFDFDHISLASSFAEYLKALVKLLLRVGLKPIFPFGNALVPLSLF